MRRLSRRDSDDELLAGTTFDKWMDVGTMYAVITIMQCCAMHCNMSIECRVSSKRHSNFGGFGRGAGGEAVVGCTVCYHVAVVLCRYYRSLSNRERVYSTMVWIKWIQLLASMVVLVVPPTYCNVPRGGVSIAAVCMSLFLEKEVFNLY